MILSLQQAQLLATIIGGKEILWDGQRKNFEGHLPTLLGICGRMIAARMVFLDFSVRQSTKPHPPAIRAPNLSVSQYSAHLHVIADPSARNGSTYAHLL